MIAAAWMKHRRIAARAGTLAVVALVTCAGGSVFAQTEPQNEDDSHVLNSDKRLWDTILGSIGLKSSGGEIIEYRERSPLVVPPLRDLPPPEANLTNKNPSWPVNPEVKARKAAAAAEKKDLTDPAKPLGPEKLAEGRGPGGPFADDSAISKKKEPGFFSMMYNGKLWGVPNEEFGKFESEPPRTTLTEPPPGYQTPSPVAPYGVSKRLETIRPEKKL